jgi:hypothetical protein
MPGARSASHPATPPRNQRFFRPSGTGRAQVCACSGSELPPFEAARHARERIAAEGDVNGRRHNAQVDYYVLATAVRWVDEEWPGWIEVQIVVDGGMIVSLIDKIPIFTDSDQIVPGTPFPVPVRVACDLVGWDPGPEERSMAVIALRHQVQDDVGRSNFRVAAENIEAHA